MVMKLVTISGLFIVLLSIGCVGQTLPRGITKYLNGNFSGWKLAGECSGEEHKAVLSGDFDGNGKRDYAVKFIRGKQGFLVAFLNKGSTFMPHYLHIWSDPDEARFSWLILFRKGEKDEQSGTPTLRFDSPADYHCESDIGGIHAFKNGKFIAY